MSSPAVWYTLFVVKHRGIVSYEPTSKMWLLLPVAMGIASVLLWHWGMKTEALLAAGLGLLFLMGLAFADRRTIERAERAAGPFLRSGFVPIDDPHEREMLLAAARKRDTEGVGGGHVVLLHGLYRDVEIVFTLQPVDVHASKREIDQVPTISLEAHVTASPTPFRIGPPLGLGFRPIERGLRALPSGFRDESLEPRWFMYAGAPATAESLLPPEVLQSPWPEERWSGGGGMLRASWHGGLPKGQSVDEMLKRFVGAVEHVNAVARGAGATRPVVQMR